LTLKIALVLMETNLPTPMTARVYVNLPEGRYGEKWWNLNWRYLHKAYVRAV